MYLLSVAVFYKKLRLTQNNSVLNEGKSLTINVSMDRRPIAVKKVVKKKKIWWKSLTCHLKKAFHKIARSFPLVYRTSEAIRY